MSEISAKEMVKTAIHALEEKKGMNIRIIDISKVSVIADYFVIAEGSNSSQIQALSDNVEKELMEKGITPRQTEGYQLANWILLDFNDIIIHIFDKENRLFYDLERIWRDGTSMGPDAFK